MDINAFKLGMLRLWLPPKLLLIMKLVILIMTVCLMQVSAAGFAQKITLNETNTPIEKILQSIRKQSGYEFIYNVKDLKDTKITVQLKDVSVDEALEASLKNLPISYKILKNNIVLTKKESSVFDRIKGYFASINVRGRVFDENSQPLQGATVSVKGSKNSVTTDYNGFYYLKNVEEDAVLVISFIGYQKAEIGVDKSEELRTVKLELSTSKLDEVQIQFAGKTSRRTSTGNITSIKASEIEKLPSNNPLLALQGQVPNLQITPVSGMPGGVVQLQLRGQNSLGGGFTQPLIIVDGVTMTNNYTAFGAPNSTAFSETGFSALSFINPSDIESIDVLKDADATSIYGSRGGNGVILITTKKGKMGSTKINIDLSSGFSTSANQLPLMNTPQYLTMRKEAFKNDGLIPSDDPNESRPGYAYAPDLTVWDQDRYTNWQDVLFGNRAINNRVQGSVSGGTQNVQYLLSGTFNSNGFVLPGEGHNRSGTGHFSLSGISDNQKLKTLLTASYTANNSLIPTVDITNSLLPPNAPAIYAPNGALNWEPNPLTGGSTWNNPYADLLKTYLTTTNNLLSSVDLSYAILPGLTVKSDVGFNQLTNNTLALTPIASQNPTLTNLSGSSTNLNSILSSWTFDPQLSYTKTISKGTLNVLVGGSLISQSTSGRYVSTSGITNDALLENPASGAFTFANLQTSQYKYVGGFARVGYNWADKYILNLSARRDGSSRFGPRNRFGNFGSLGAAWVFTNEQFMQKYFPVLSFGKLRMSYGTSGNDGIGDYQYIELFQPLGGYSPVQYQGIKPLASNGSVNGDYHWENIAKGEVGLDLGFLNDRLTLGTSYWRTRSSNQLGTLTLAATSGVSTLAINQSAKIQNSGADFAVNSINIKSNDFTWSTSANLGIQRNKLLALPKDFFGANQQVIQYYQAKNLDPINRPFTGIQPVYQSAGVDPETGYYVFRDGVGNIADVEGGDGSATSVYLAPKYAGSMTNSFSYKGLTLSVMLQFVKQMVPNYLYNTSFATPGSWAPYRAATNQPASLLDQVIWQSPGDIADIQRFTAQSFATGFSAFNKAGASDKAFADGSFVKVRNLFLSYEIPEKWKQKLQLKGMNIFFQGQNLWTFSGYKGLDPELPSVLSVPQLRTLMTGISVKF